MGRREGRKEKQGGEEMCKSKGRERDKSEDGW